MTTPTSDDPRNALSLIAQFGAEYLLTFADKPATRECVSVQLKDALARVDAALQELSMLKAAADAGAVTQ